MSIPTGPASRTDDEQEIVERSRLIRQLDAARGRRYALITGQAAQGKTTLAATYLTGSRVPGAWMHLEPKDADAANVYALAVHSVQQAFPDQDLSEFTSPPTLSLGDRAGISRYRDRLVALFDRLSRPLIAVFDGLENLQPGSTAISLIDDLLHTPLPPGIRMFLLSREMPPFRLQRLKVNRQLAVVTNEDLAFTCDEIDFFFQARTGMSLEPTQVEHIWKITGGWAGGLVLIAEGLKKVPESDRAAWIGARLPELLQGEVLQYFSEEVFAAQPERVRNLLILSSVLEVVDPAVLAKMAGEPDAAAIFQDLARRNLFIHPVVDHQKGPLYRHNRLFRDFLGFLFRERLPEKERQELLGRTGELFWNAGELEKAVEFFLPAGRTERAVDGIMQTAMDLSIRGRTADLARWIDALPDERVSGDPWLLLYRALSRRISGGKRTMEELAAVLERFDDRNVRGQLLCLAHLIEAGVFFGADPTRLRLWIRGGEALLRKWSKKPFYAYAKSLLWLQIGFGRIAGLGELQKGLSACQNAYLLALRIGDNTLQINATIVSVLGMAVAGDFGEADRALERIGRIGSTADCPEYRVLQSIVDIRLAMNRGDFDQALQALERSRADIETFGLLFVYPTFVETAGRLALYRGDFAEAERYSEHLSDVAVLADNPYYLALSIQLAAMIRYHIGDFGPARRLITEALSKLPGTRTASIHRLRLHQVEGLVLLHLGETDLAEAALSRALGQLAGMASPLALAETHLGLGLVYQAAGDPVRAREHLRIGFSTAAEKGYVHFLVLRPADIARACLLIAGSEGAESRYAAHLLSSRYSDAPGVEPEALFQGDRTAAQSPPLDIQRTLYRSRLPRIDIVTLGKFTVLIGGRDPIDDRQWAGNRPKLLLKSIVVHGCRDIPRDILVDDLWPDSDGDAAAKNFKVTLHRLRKVLEPGLSREIGSAYVHLKDSRVSLDRELCRTDVEIFLTKVREIRRLSDRASAEVVLARCVEAAAVYGGDFLPEEPYLPWAEMKRTVLQDQYVEILMKMAELYSEQGRLHQAADCCKQILRVDPSSDSACQRLMAIYQRQGMRTEAMKVYESFRSHLISDIGVEPDPETSAIYRSLQHFP